MRLATTTLLAGTLLATTITATPTFQPADVRSSDLSEVPFSTSLHRSPPTSTPTNTVNNLERHLPSLHLPFSTYPLQPRERQRYEIQISALTPPLPVLGPGEGL